MIGTRGSKLALWQAHWVRDELAAKRPGLDIEVRVIKTQGDARHDLSPEAFGAEGIFTAELDRALLDGSIDVAVHSLKDLPTRLGKGLVLAAVTERASTADVLILREDRVAELGVGAKVGPEALEGRSLVIGTSSLRRVAQLKARFPKLEFAPMRGNLDTRIRKLGEKKYDAIVVAKAGLDRLKIDIGGHAAIQLLSDWYLPAAGQGALAVESTETGKGKEIGALLDHPPTRAAVTSERAAMAALGAGCRVPAGFLGEVDNGTIRLRGVAASCTGDPIYQAETQGPVSDPESVGKALAKKLLDMGAADVLREVRG